MSVARRPIFNGYKAFTLQLPVTVSFPTRTGVRVPVECVFQLYAWAAMFALTVFMKENVASLGVVLVTLETLLGQANPCLMTLDLGLHISLFSIGLL